MSSGGPFSGDPATARLVAPSGAAADLLALGIGDRSSRLVEHLAEQGSRSSSLARSLESAGHVGRHLEAAYPSPSNAPPRPTRGQAHDDFALAVIPTIKLSESHECPGSTWL